MTILDYIVHIWLIALLLVIVITPFTCTGGIPMKLASETKIKVVKAFRTTGEKISNYSMLYLSLQMRHGKADNNFSYNDFMNCDHISIDRLDNSNISKWCLYKDKKCVKVSLVKIVPIGSLYI